MRPFVALLIWIVMAMLAPLPARAQFFGGGGKSAATPSHPIETLRAMQGTAENSLQYGTLSALHGQTITLVPTQNLGKGLITELQLNITSADAPGREQPIFSFYIDGESTPSLVVKMGELMGTLFKAGVDPSHTYSHYWRWYRTSTQMTYNWRIPIPFNSSFRIDVTDQSPTSGSNHWGTVRYRTGITTSFGNLNRLHAASFQSAIAASTTQTLINISGTGVALCWGGFMQANSAWNWAIGATNSFAVTVDGNNTTQGLTIADWIGNVRFLVDGLAAPAENEYFGIHYDVSTGNPIANWYREDDLTFFNSSLAVSITTGNLGGFLNFTFGVLYYSRT